MFQSILVCKIIILPFVKMTFSHCMACNKTMGSNLKRNIKNSHVKSIVHNEVNPSLIKWIDLIHDRCGVMIYDQFKLLYRTICWACYSISNSSS